MVSVNNTKIPRSETIIKDFLSTKYTRAELTIPNNVNPRHFYRRLLLYCNRNPMFEVTVSIDMKRNCTPKLFLERIERVEFKDSTDQIK